MHLAILGAAVAIFSQPPLGWGSSRFDAASRELILRMGIVALMATSLALVNGVAGQFSLGHAAFQAVSAYIAAGVFALVWSDPSGTIPQGWLSARSPVILQAWAWGTIMLGALIAAAVG